MFTQHLCQQLSGAALVRTEKRPALNVLNENDTLRRENFSRTFNFSDNKTLNGTIVCADTGILKILGSKRVENSKISPSVFGGDDDDDDDT